MWLRISHPFCKQQQCIDIVKNGSLLYKRFMQDQLNRLEFVD